MQVTTISDIKLPVGREGELLRIAEKRLGGKAGYFAIKKKSLDARDKGNIRYVYTIECARENPPEQKTELERLPKNRLPKAPVLVVGSGPAGLFACLRLLERGIPPLLIERGAPVEKREGSIRSFFRTGSLNTEVNVQFGEGGAGTFSDGKLNTQTHNPLIGEVLRQFVRFGAPEEIVYLSKPHIGSDNLKKVVKRIREYILSQGGKVLFHTRLEDLRIENGRLIEAELRTFDADGVAPKTERVPVSALLLAVGHSARDTFEMLHRRGVPMKAKDFAVGVRIEHLQKNIGFAQYGKGYASLPAADYKLVARGKDRSAFTFCMCPGGYVMPAASEEGGVVVNGMSNYARDGENANSALIAQVTQADFGGDSPLAGMYFQRSLERKAFLAGGGEYVAPVQLVGDFLKNQVSARFGEVKPTYERGTAFADLREVLPASVIECLQNAILDMDRRLKGFANPEGVLTGVESRTSSPVRIERGEDFQSLGVQGLFPCGEGAGYAGGITSSAVDGIRVADGVYRFLAVRE